MNPEQALVDEARAASHHAYAPYSHFHVGAALRTAGGHVYRGTNVENVSFGLTNCAERSAVFNAVSAGEREFEMIAVVAPGDRFCTPCGACRQVLAEFNKSLPVLMGRMDGSYERTTLDRLLPGAYGAGELF